MKNTIKQIFINILNNNRVKSFFWRMGMLTLAAIIAYFIGLLPTLTLPGIITAILGVILGEISKFINQTLSTKANL